jgi:hypothetical protein
MKVLNISKNGTIKCKMSDGRLGYTYRSGYVRVSLKHNNKRLYQINTKRTNYNAKRSNYYYTRELLYNELDRLRLLYAFDQNNCQNPEWILTKNI